ncbi:flagellar biosynthesis anti-sigma factor FlgM [Catenovulum sp. SM1970]|uniref:flagellar biosynthesis anti-sigma factor FlgM n=1 Tax=Marinifaba aquimaris TaxID=2741323 RepID=UPI001574DBBB|nr:flagellar biosynthesis anti-sigma factor FlgM [Marinifaba aquimaris]NTS75408.1 flagellar biosynthesis anti-sigma factor FlgM [Marinifaba aquimaris]
MAININNLGNNNQVNAKQAEQRNQQQVQQNNQQAQSAQQAQTSAPRQDSVSLTNSAQQVSNATQKAKDASGFDQQKVDKLKKAISEGGYKVDAERLAQNIIASEGKLFGL